MVHTLFCTDVDTEAQGGPASPRKAVVETDPWPCVWATPPALTPLYGALSGGICRATALSAAREISGPNSRPSEGKRLPGQSLWRKPNPLVPFWKLLLPPTSPSSTGLCSHSPSAPFPSLTPPAAPARACARWTPARMQGSGFQILTLCIFV